MIFDNIEDLKNHILLKSETAVKLAQERIYQIISSFVKEYYAEYSPEVYERTYQLFRSLVKSRIFKVGNEWQAQVYFDLDRLDYHVKHFTKKEYRVDGGFRNPFNGDISSTGTFPNTNNNGGTVGDFAQKTMESAARGEHGGYKVGTAIWTDPIVQINREKYNLFKKVLLDAGIPVK